MSSAHRFGRPGDRRRRSIGNQYHDSNRGIGSSSIQRSQRGQREEYRWNSTMNRQYEDRRFRSQTYSTYRCSQRSSEGRRSSEAETMTFPGKSRHNESDDYAKRLESTSSRKNSPRYRRPRESRSTTRRRDRKSRSKESWARNSRSISRERFLKLRQYWSKSRSRSSSAQRSADERSTRFSPKTNDDDFQESPEMVNFQRNFSKGPDPRLGSAVRQQYPAKSSKSPAKSPESPAVVRVANLTWKLTKGHLIEIFSRCGRVKNVVFDRHRKENPCAFIEFYNKADREYAVSTMNEGEIDGKLIEVTLAGGSSRVPTASPKIIFRHRTPPPMPHAMMIQTGRLFNQRRFVNPIRDKVETIPRDFNRKRKF